MSDATTVRPHLLRWFDSRRVVFWHDPDGQYAADLDGLDLPGVETIQAANNEFGIKNRLLHSLLEPILARTLGVPVFRNSCCGWRWSPLASPAARPKNCGAPWASSARSGA